jgi:divalent metal cation (Fe/Co/Zn/Cd) transporter
MTARESAPDQDRRHVVLRALIVETITVLWMIAEAVIAIGAGIVARSVALTTFGLDSVIELASAGVLVWRLRVELTGGDDQRIETAEHRATRLAGGGLVLLCVYVVAATAAGLASRSHPEGSVVGVVISSLAVLVMPVLGVTKRRLANRLGSAALRADAAETIACAYLADTTVAGVLLNALFGWWWADTLAALLLIVWLAREAREALSDDEDDDD